MHARSLLPLAVTLAVMACDNKKPNAADAGAGPGASVACYAAEQFRCKELPAPNAAQRDALAVECSSGSGALTSPASCPAAKFVGKCTVPPQGVAAQEVRRFYAADDAAYQQDFCINTAKGIWSATF